MPVCKLCGTEFSERIDLCMACLKEIALKRKETVRSYRIFKDNEVAFWNGKGWETINKATGLWGAIATIQMREKRVVMIPRNDDIDVYAKDVVE
jgi:hypothetical protein